MRRILAGSAVLAVASFVAVPAAVADTLPPGGIPKFRMQEIDKTLKVGYGVRLVDLNGDKKTDIVVADSARVIWFENPGGTDGAAAWKLHTIIDDKAAGIKPDNVCIDVADIDGDGKLDLALGADWQPNNTKAGGSLQWLRQPADIGQPWTVHRIFESEPTLHRVHFGDVDGDGRPELIVGPLKGKDSTGPKNWSDAGVRLAAYRIPKDPTQDKWESDVLTTDLHVMHNFLPVRFGNDKEGVRILTASYEGVNLLHKGDGNKWKLIPMGAGNQDNPNGSRGSSEIKRGQLGGSGLMGTIEPFHGNQVVVYTPPAVGADPATLWTRTVLDSTLKDGHGISLADLDGDGNDEVVAGWRGAPKVGIRVYRAVDPKSSAAPAGAKSEAPNWVVHELDPGGVAVEDLACADLNGDGRVDIVAVGRATGNVRVYWNEGAGK